MIYGLSEKVAKQLRELLAERDPNRAQARSTVVGNPVNALRINALGSVYYDATVLVWHSAQRAWREVSDTVYVWSYADLTVGNVVMGIGYGLERDGIPVYYCPCDCDQPGSGPPPYPGSGSGSGGSGMLGGSVALSATGCACDPAPVTLYGVVSNSTCGCFVNGQVITFARDIHFANCWQAIPGTSCSGTPVTLRFCCTGFPGAFTVNVICAETETGHDPTNTSCSPFFFTWVVSLESCCGPGNGFTLHVSQ